MTGYRSEILHVAELSRRSGISQRTIFRFLNAGLEYDHYKGRTFIDIHEFLHYVHKHYRFKRINLIQGKRWAKDELANPIGRTPNAIRLKIYRDIKLNKRK